MKLTVIYEKAPTSWEGMREEGISVPPQSSFAGAVEINSAA
jgi:hypothetical protein